MSASELKPLTKVSEQAARQLFSQSENLAKYMNNFKQVLPDLKNLKKTTKTIQKSVKVVEKVIPKVTKVEKVVSEAKKVIDAITKNIPGKDTATKAAKAGSSIGAFIAIGGVAVILALKIKLDELTQAANERDIRALNNDLSKTNGLVGLVNGKVERLNNKIYEIGVQANRNDGQIYSVQKEQVRQREKLNSYGTELLELERETVKEKRTFDAIVSNQRKDIEKLKISATNRNNENFATAKFIAILEERLRAMGIRVNSIQQLKPIPGKNGTNGKDGKPGTNGKNGLDGKNGLNGKPGIDGKNGLNGSPGLDGQPGINGRNGIDGIGKPGINGLPGKDGNNGNNGKDGINGRNGIDGKPGINGLNGRNGTDGKDGLDGKSIVGLPGKDGKDGINGRDGKDLEVDLETKNLVKQIAGNAAFIPALVARPVPLTQSQTQLAAAAGTCQTMQPGGCSDNAIKRNADGLFDRLSPLFNTGANAAQLAQLAVINNKLGAQIPGGIGGKLVDGFKWLQLDRALNILTFAATVHNAVMLSNDIGQTLIGAFTNVLTLIIPKDEKGQAFNVNEAIGNTVTGIVTGIVGAENYAAISAGWAKANRVYQATTNVLNNVLSLTQTILQSSEMIAAYTGKIGNALKQGGVILENAYGYMNPQPKFNRVSQTLEAFQATASTIQMVTQAPLDIINATTEFNNSATEFTKAIKEDGKVNGNGTEVNKAVEIPEPEKLKADAIAGKVASQPNPFDFSDLFDGDDL